ncbi:hypothetical protein CHLNCDRAFT_135248 [Chlorella variabilis]|uniref:Non-haem dioxygenase N-terminal domain-containing protein n=1 Tax=Chlorella variabilis TaxID=554065 RepID=E1ZHT5_CHLVA|nr:hypothetical protein CHLNCDRAFT_135248 [Chlorella variabilis]EFN54659.1 hypothetical protein CHLNCDRAFT_135248 [Chlorella variabilis]|eukprot:XP_005846761.1 hypothetical protein CHLNCDRAFT_135248 [Chlorella variabilis]
MSGVTPVTGQLSASSRVVVLRYEDLANPDVDISAQLEEAYGPSGLGIATVSGVPGYEQLRQGLLPLAAKLAALPQATLSALEDPGSRFSFGWSCGRETLEGGQPDTRKGSFYANPLHDDPSCGDADLQRRFPSYCRPNMWPRSELPVLEAAFKALGRLILNVGLLLAGHADKYVASKAGYPPRLHDILRQSPCPKGRLLHYFAPVATAGTNPVRSCSIDANWCGWHTDHGSLTGLCSALYIDMEGRPVACPDPQSGLHVKDRSGHVIQVAIPEDHVGFQIGEAMQVHSGGLLRGTPHCVVAPRPEFSAGVSRNTFAVFTQPKWDYSMDAPAGARPEDVGIGQWRPGLDFGGFSELTFNAYYKE